MNFFFPKRGFAGLVSQLVQEFLAQLFLLAVSNAFEDLTAFLDDLFDSRLAGVAGVDEREDFLLERVLQILAFLKDVLCRSGSADDDSLQVRNFQHHLVEVVPDAFVVVVDDLFSDPLEPSSRLSTSPALARCSRSERLQNLYSASLQSGYDCFCPVNHEYSVRVLVGDERE